MIRILHACMKNERKMKRIKKDFYLTVYLFETCVGMSPSLLFILEVSLAPSHCCFNLLFHWTGTGWYENSTRWKSCKQVQTCGGGA